MGKFFPTCKNFPLFYFRAKNHFGSVTHNYTLEVTPVNPLTSHGPLAIVTGISPQNTSLHVGQSGELTCTVKSHDRPHIKWLKEVSGDFEMTSEAANILNVKDNRYQILPTADDIKVNSNEYINILALKEVTEAQNGTYICFVAKNGLTSLTFKSATVFIIQGTNHIVISYELWPKKQSRIRNSLSYITFQIFRMMSTKNLISSRTLKATSP